jgi:hypothetical protein
MRAATIALLLCLAAPLAGAAAAPSPDVVLSGEVTYANYNTYLELPFTVPEGVSRLSVQFSYEGAEQRTTIDLGLADPHGMRGWSGGNKKSFTLSATDATPSYQPGRIDAGEWHLILGVPNIRQGVVSHYRAEISFGRREETALKEGYGWYRGDLHMHTAHSDGFCLSRSGRKVNCPVFRTIEAAEAAGLDFIAISDHNATTQYQDLRELQPFFDKTLLIPGRELTTFHGHANEWGVTQDVDFRHGANAMADQVHKLGGLFSLNHPNAPTGESCMGCGWDAPGFDFAKADAVEVVNGGGVREAGDDKGLALAFWRSLLDKGLSPTAVGGSDNHDPDLPVTTSGSVGSPATVVYAASLSQQAILDGIKAGHVFVQVRGGDPARRVELTSGKAMMGDHLKAHGAVPVTLHVVGVEGGHVEFLSDAPPAADHSPLKADDSLAISWRPGTGHHWLAVLVRDQNGQAVLLSNPLYVES